MSKPSQKPEQDALAERLRCEAAATRPEFSRALHARICRAVAESRPCEPAAPKRGDTRVFLRLRTLVAVAAACLAAVAVPWQPEESSSTVRPPRIVPFAPHAPVASVSPQPAEAWEPEDALIPLDDLTDATKEGLREWLSGTLAVRQWTYLDEDARLVLEGLKNQIPLDVSALLASSEPPSDE